jgi:hypothetical protein
MIVDTTLRPAAAGLALVKSLKVSACSRRLRSWAFGVFSEDCQANLKAILLVLIFGSAISWGIDLKSGRAPPHSKTQAPNVRLATTAILRLRKGVPVF